MEAAVGAGVPGIVGECGGNAVCGTCHVYVACEEVGALPPVSPAEAALLEFVAAERRPTSRLSCQLPLSPGGPDLVLLLPDRQW